MNKKYFSSGENYQNLLKSIKSYGFKSYPRGLEISELINENLNIFNNNILMHVPGVRDVIDPNTKEGQYLRAEFVWYMSGKLDTNFISKFGKMWERLGNNFYTDDILNGMINSNYGYHVFYRPINEKSLYAIEYCNYKAPDQISSFEWIINELETDIDSRKAIIHYTWPVIYRKGVRDFTCTQTQHFIVRENYLFNLVHIRSSDAIKGLTFDIPWWDFVGQLAAKILKVKYGSLQINMGSSHYYSTDSELIDKLINTNNLEFARMTLREEKDIVNRLNNTVEYIKSIHNNNDNFYKLDDIVNRYDNSKFSFYKYIMDICKYYLSTKDLLKSKDVMIDINNRIFDSVFTY